jgi:hypothetical protein
MPENKVSIILEAADKTKEAFNSVKSNSEGLLSSLKSHWAEFTAAGASIYGLIKGVQDFVNVAAEAEQIESRMAFQIEAVGVKYKDVKTAIDAFATSIQNTTRFSDDAARSGLQQMMQYTVNLSEAMKGLKLAMDMATQVAGGDLTLAIKYVGMAMNGDIEVLSKMNPAFKNLTNTLGENATQAEKMAFGLKELTRLFGGASEKDLSTYGGKVDQLNKGWIEFKKTLGGELIPTLNEVLDLLTKIGKVGIAGAVGGTEKERIEAEIASWNDTLKNLPEGTGKMQLDIMAKIEDAKKRIIVIDNQQAGAEKKVAENAAAVADASKKAADAKGLNDFITNWDKWEKQSRNLYTLTDELSRAFTDLGITSVRDTAGAADAAVANMERIKKAMTEGKASIKDYQNALTAAKTALEKLVSPDITNAMADLQKKYEEGAKAFSREDPEFRKKIEAWADSINEEMKKITGPSVAELEAQVKDLKTRAQTELNKEPLGLKLDTADFTKKIMDAYKEVKGKIESDPIKVKVDVSGGNGGGAGYGTSGQSPLMPGMSGYSEAVSTLSIPVNYDFTGTGMSPKMALGDALKKLIDKFGNIKDLITGMQVEISFEETSIQLKGLEKQMDQYKAVQQGWQNIINSGWASINMMTNWKNPQADVLAGLMSDLQDQIDVMKKQQALSVLQGVEGSFQTGIGYVPKTGKYLLHKGEKVSTTNQVSDNRVNNFYISGTDPKKIADQIEKVLKYQISGSLIEEIRKIR